MSDSICHHFACCNYYLCAHPKCCGFRGKIPNAVRATEWWISDGDAAHGAPKILGPFATRDLALEVRMLFEAHPRAKGLTYWVSEVAQVTAPPASTSEED